MTIIKINTTAITICNHCELDSREDVKHLLLQSIELFDFMRQVEFVFGH